jgi:hypothetical protein
VESHDSQQRHRDKEKKFDESSPPLCLRGESSFFRFSPALPLLALVALLPLISCKLIDQTTFAPSPAKNPQLLPTQPPPAPARPIDQRVALLTIDQGTSPQQARPLLAYAVGQARSRDPNVQFDVVAVIPAAGDFDPARAEAGAIMTAIVADGVRPDRVHLRAAIDPSLTRRQTRVYVR